MARTRRALLALAAIISLTPLAVRTPMAQAPANHVVIISLDGFTARALDDPYLPLPALRRLIAGGAAAKSMRPVDPTVTWANHTSMVTGVPPAKHGVIFNGLLVSKPGMPPVVEPWRDRSEMVHARTLYDAVHEKGMTTAQVDWVAIWNAPTVTWEFREKPDVKETIPREMIAAGLVSEADVAAFSAKNIVWRDEIWTSAAAFILKQHRPNLLMFHLLNLDSTQHRYGPDTPAAVTAMTHLDAQVAKIVSAVDEAGMTARTTFVIVSDHGFKTVKRQIRLNAAFAKSGLLKVQDGKVVSAEAYSVPEGGSALVYVTVPDASGDVLKRVKPIFDGIEGIDRVVEPSEYARYGLPLPSESNQMGAFFVLAKPGYAFTADVAGDVVIDAPLASLGSHGYVATDPELQAIFIASGRGVKPGVHLDRIDNLDIAPTIARLLGVELSGVQGRVLTEILR